MVVPASLASAFGTIDSGGQHREHERITRPRWPAPARPHRGRLFRGAVDGLPRGARPRVRGCRRAGQRRDCRSCGALRQRRLSGRRYPRTREQASDWAASTASTTCAQGSAKRWSRRGSARQRGPDGRRRGEPRSECKVLDIAEQRAKCAALEASDGPCTGRRTSMRTATGPTRRIPARPIGDDNRPGLNLPGRVRCSTSAAARAAGRPAGLATGCFVLRTRSPGAGECVSG